jgi:alpha-L-arabinofuranosidase
VKFYSAIKASYPDIKIISSCDASAISPANPADLYDVHVRTALIGVHLIKHAQ